MINKYALLNQELVESFRLIGIKYNGLSSNRIEITKFKALHRNTYMLIGSSFRKSVCRPESTLQDLLKLKMHAFFNTANKANFSPLKKRYR